jgi:endonuclease/exonuclease/phosphatase family metal-dependent hydrolase
MLEVKTYRGILIAHALVVALPAVALATQDIRIAAYNMDDDVTGSTGYNPNLNAGTDTAIEGIDAYTGPYKSPATQGSLPAQTIDILGLEETSVNTSTGVDSTATNIVSDLNNYAQSIGSSAVYATPAIPAAAQTTGVGNGPNAVVYNTTTMTLLGSVAITGTGIDRPVMRYEFQPVNGTASQVFYVYVSHAKSSSSGNESTDETMRNEEAQAIRANSSTLGNANIVYMGDFNMNGTSEAMYQTLTSSSTYSTGAGIDPANPSNNYNITWSESTTPTLLSETDTNLRYRDDIQFMTGSIYNGTGYLKYVAGSQVPFGNNGTATNVASSTGTGIPSSVLSALTTASDHVPIVADYSFTSALTPGDATGDGTVNLSDLSIVLDNLGDATPLWSRGNFDGAATIDLTDLSDVLNNFGSTGGATTSVVSQPAVAPAPEPATLGILSLSAAVLFIKRRSIQS